MKKKKRAGILWKVLIQTNNSFKTDLIMAVSYNSVKQN